MKIHKYFKKKEFTTNIIVIYMLNLNRDLYLY